MTHYNEQFFEEVLAARDRGENRDRILELFHNDKEEVKKIFELIDLFKDASVAERPRREGLEVFLRNASSRQETFWHIFLRPTIMFPAGAFALIVFAFILRGNTAQAPSTLSLKKTSFSLDESAPAQSFSIEDPLDLAVIKKEEETVKTIDASLTSFATGESNLNEIDMADF